MRVYAEGDGSKEEICGWQYLKGALESDIQGMILGSSKSSGTEMTNLQESQELSLLVNSKLEREDIFKLGIIKRFDSLDNYAITPDTDIKGLLDRNAVQFLYVKEARNFYTYLGKYCYSKLVFESLNDKLADSGYSVANYVQMAQAGSGFAGPRLKLIEEERVPETQKPTYQENPNLILRRKRPPAPLYQILDKKKLFISVIVDPGKVVDVGIGGCQIRIDNTAIIHSIRLMGYPTPYDASLYTDPERPGVYDMGYVFASRPLFAKYLLPGVNHPLNTHLKMEDTYYLVAGIQPVIDFYQEFKENKKSAYDESIKSSFEGHIRSDYQLTTRQAYKGGEPRRPEQIGSKGWDNGLKEIFADWPQAIFDFPRSLFANIFSRRLSRYGNVNEKIKVQELEKKSLVNVLALNAFAHHDIITLPIGINQTLTTESLDIVDDITERLPVLGGLFNNVIRGFHSMVFGKSPSGFKRGGLDKGLEYYGSSMMGLMSMEMYRFYTGAYQQSLSTEGKGIMPFNAFQDQGNEHGRLLSDSDSLTSRQSFKLRNAKSEKERGKKRSVRYERLSKKSGKMLSTGIQGLFFLTFKSDPIFLLHQLRFLENRNLLLSLLMFTLNESLLLGFLRVER